MDPLIVLDSHDFICGKAIQLYIDKNPIIVLGETLKHSELLEEVLEKYNIPFESVKNRPKILGERYELVGVSWAIMFPPKITLSNGSNIYQMGPSSTHASEWMARNPSIIIEIEKYATRVS